MPELLEHATDGAPLVADGHISRSHDGAWTAVALSPRPVGIDLCLRAHAPRIVRVLKWLAIECDADPVAQFAALEAALKLRRLSIEHLLSRRASITRADHALVVHGLGDDIRVELHHHPAHVVAVCG